MPLDCFAHWVEKKGDKDYLVQPMADGSVVNLTWKEVDDQARRFASFGGSTRVLGAQRKNSWTEGAQRRKNNSPLK